MGRNGLCTPASLVLVASLAFGCSPDAPQETEEPLVAPQAAKEAPLPAPAKPKDPAQQVVYTIAHGGTILDVANLYKIHHHEIQALNPGIPPDRALPVGRPVVVYEYDRERSESIGLPHDGSLVGGMPMPDGPGRRVTALRWKSWATRSTVLELDRVLRKWARQKGANDILVSNLSARHGGPLDPHKTHQSGRDVDLGYPTKQHADEWRHVTVATLDAERTWRLLKLLEDTGRVEVIFMDRALQRKLLEHALARGTMERSRLASWFEVAKGARGKGPLIKHVPGHSDHFHVRFRCRDDEPRCRS